VGVVVGWVGSCRVVISANISIILSEDIHEDVLESRW